MKACKVFCVYFGPKRGSVSCSPDGPLKTLELFKYILDTDSNTDPGVESLDTIIVHNVFEGDIPKECLDFLNEVNDTKTDWGSITVLDRHERLGASLGAYSYAYDHFEGQYDYWFFCEDDIRVYRPGYYQLAVNEFEEDPKLGFLALTNINFESDFRRKHVSGGFGIANRESLEKVKDKFGFLPYDKSGGGYGQFGTSEQLFTNCFIRLDYNVRIPNNLNFVPLADNWIDFSPQRVWQSKNKLDIKDKNFFYHIGLK
ncbi:MAG: hypothetical protein CL605_05455 [Altibacter sp.]|uniref:hypothetical protein n=1 Tax=Altibacter sp. TaxID=2024823 RepID=UPI000C8C25A7|nr:hypothetical protein [Altibacter sp.]MAP54330.1 hypothetical protein [Altibacter sp.]|tara:strand:- start:3318 stop:4088 length:771 start_codon:yes stop_codon:yes gene_type:complete